MKRIIKLKKPMKRLLQITEENRYQAKLGDIFTLSIHKGEYMYGRVVCIDPKFDFSEPNPHNYILIYLYKNTSKNKYSIPNLDKNNLLCPPFVINKEIWMWGYFQSLKNEELNTVNMHIPICFNYDFLVRDMYRNEKGDILDKIYPGCATTGLSNIEGVEYEILNAIGEKIEEY